MIWGVSAAVVCSFTFAIWAFKHKPFATKLKAVVLLKYNHKSGKMQGFKWGTVQAKAKETGDNLNMLNQT